MRAEFLELLGKKIRLAREAKGISQEQLAESTGVSRPSLISYEKGRTLPPLDFMSSVSKLLDTDFVIDGLFIGRQGTTPAEPPAEQMCLEFGVENAFEGATLKITASKNMIRVTASAPRERKAS